VSAAALALALLAGPAHSAPPQDPPAIEQEESELDKLVRAARTGRAHIRPQAARRILRLWMRGDETVRAEVLARLHDEAGETPGDLAALGSAMVEVLAEFEDEALRARLWAAVDDPDFPWRPYAARGLATTAQADERPRLRALLEDPIGPVRGAGVLALHTLDTQEDADVLRERLADEADYVRRTAADLLVRWGHDDVLWYLFEELRRDDRFFDRPTGREARYQAYTVMLTHLGDLGSYDAGRTPQQNKVVLAVLRTKIQARAGARPELPGVAVATETPGGEVIGLELRSCRRGEFYLRWTDDDRLLVGQGNPAVVDLPAGTTARLRTVAAGRTAEVEARSVGAPGCDLEILHWRPEEAAEMWIVSKGPEAVEDLRPAPLGVLHGALIATLPDGEHADPRLDRLRSRALEALAAVGGPLE
jgi:hypothetical protein